MNKIIQKSNYLSTDWITDFTRSFKRLAQTDFLTHLEKSTFNRNFITGKPLESSVKDTIWSEILFFRNVLRDIYDG